MKNKKCLILANGKPPRKSVIKYFQNNGFTELFCADGGANSARKYGLIPQFIIGDFDSITPVTIKHYSAIARMIKIKRQNDTDLEKCIKYAITKKYFEAVIIGGTGDRLDHTFCNIGIVLKYFPKIQLSLVAENSYLKTFTNDIELKTLPGETISIYGFDNKTKIISSGLKYPLNNISLPFGIKDSTSNVSKSYKVLLKIKGGMIFVIRNINFLIKNDLI